MATDERRTDRELFDMIQSLLNHGEAGYTYVKIDAHLSALRELQSLRAQGGVRVKPLEWVRVTEPTAYHGGEPKRYWKASDALGGWVWVNVHSDDFDGEASWGGVKYPSSEAAMNAAEEHRRDRILSSLKGDHHDR